MQHILRDIFPHMTINGDAQVAVNEFNAYLQGNRDLNAAGVNKDYIFNVNRMANYFDKADFLIASLYVDQELFLSFWSPFIIRFYATFRAAYFENANFPQSLGLKRIAIKALNAYKTLHIGQPDSQFANIDFGQLD